MNEKNRLKDEELEEISGGVGNDSLNGKNEKKYYCQYCPKGFTTKNALINHIKKAHPGEPVVY